jgi:hypothetical protein
MENNKSRRDSGAPAGGRLAGAAPRVNPEMSAGGRRLVTERGLQSAAPLDEEERQCEWGVFGVRLAGMQDVPASRSAGILPALANEVGKGGTLAAILSHPIGRWARLPPSLTRRLRGTSESQPSQSKNVYKDQGDAPGWDKIGALPLKTHAGAGALPLKIALALIF